MAGRRRSTSKLLESRELNMAESHPFHVSTSAFLTLSGSFIPDINHHGAHTGNSTANGKNKGSQSSDVSYTRLSNTENLWEETTSSNLPVMKCHSAPSEVDSNGINIKINGTQARTNGHYEEKVETEQNIEIDLKDSKADNNKKLKFSQMSRRSKYTFIMLGVANFGAGCGFSLPAPFFPREAEKKGASATAIGLVFSSFQLITFLASPLFGNYLTKIGAKFLYTSGILVAGTCATLFGFLDMGPSGTVFIAMSFLVRSVEALGVAAFSTASFAIISNEFPQYIGSVFATLETCVGIGLMIGPTIGAALYEVGGFGLPFWVIGTVINVSGLLIFGCLPEPKDSNIQRKGSILVLLKSCIVWVSMLCVLSGSCSLAFLDPTLSDHLDKFGLSTLEVGLFFVIVPGIYAISAPLYGFISDTKDIQAPLLIGGNLVCAIGYIFIGPSPLLPFLPRELWTVTLGLGLFGLGIGSTIVPTMKCYVIGAGELGLPDDLNTFGLVAGLFNSIFSLGAFIGPTIGGALVDEIGFHSSSSIIAAVFIFSMLVSMVFFGRRRLGKNEKTLMDEVPHRVKTTSMTQEITPHSERSPLLERRSLSRQHLLSPDDSYSSASFSQVPQVSPHYVNLRRGSQEKELSDSISV